MRVKTTNGDVIRMPVGGAMAGMGVTEITFTVEDVRAMQEKYFPEWLQEFALCRLMPEEKSNCACKGFYQPVDCPVHGGR